MKKMYVFILLILPVILVFTAALLHYANGPYWIGYNSDPEYLYLVNSLALAESKETPTTGNPGTTLQMLGAATLKITHVLNFSVNDSLEYSVLKNPEYYLTVINIILIIINTCLLFIIGLRVFTLTKNIWLSLLLQFSPFLFNGTLTQCLSRISPEPLLLCAGLLFLLILVKMVFNKDLSKSTHWYMIALALVSGFGMATKLTFVPLLIIPLFVLPKLRNKIGFLFMTGISFVLWTWPIIPQYKTLFEWYYRTLTHTGYYGLGNVGIINLEVYLENMIFHFLCNPLFFLIWFFAVGFILRFIWFSATRKKSWQDTSFRILAAVTVAQLCAFLIVAKYSVDRYLLPALSLSGLMLFLMFVFLKRLDCFSRFEVRKVVLFFAIFFIMISAWRIYDIKNVYAQKLQIKQESLAIYNQLEDEYKNYLKISYSFPSFRSSSPAAALAFGNFFIGNGLYSESLQKIYGENYFYDGLSGIFHTWTKEYSIEDFILKGHSDKAILYGPPLHTHNNNKIIFLIDSNPYFWKRWLSIEDVILKDNSDKLPCRIGSILHLKDVFVGEHEAIYFIEGITMDAGKFHPFTFSPCER